MFEAVRPQGSQVMMTQKLKKKGRRRGCNSNKVQLKEMRTMKRQKARACLMNQMLDFSSCTIHAVGLSITQIFFMNVPMDTVA